MLKERITFISGWGFFPPIFFFWFFCFKSYLSTLEFGEEGCKNSHFSESGFPISCLVWDRVLSLSGAAVTVERWWQCTPGAPETPGAQPPAPAQGSWATTSRLLGLAEGTPEASLVLVGLDWPRTGETVERINDVCTREQSNSQMQSNRT